MVWPTQKSASRRRRHVNGPLQTIDRLLPHCPIGADRVGVLRCNRDATAAHEALVPEFLRNRLVVGRVPLEQRHLNAVVADLLQRAEDWIMFTCDMRGPKQQI